MAKKFTYVRDGKEYEKNSKGQEVLIGAVDNKGAKGDKASDDSGLSATKTKELQSTSGLGALAKRNKARKKASSDLSNTPPKKKDDKPF